MIEKLKALEANALPGPWFAHSEAGVQVLEQKDADFVCALRNLAPELIALWEASDPNKYDDGDSWDDALAAARRSLERKAKEVL